MKISELLRKREIIIDSIRGFFKSEGFREVETPLAVPSPGMEPHLDAFELRGTHGGRRRYLHTSPEYAMKKLLGAGSGNIFQMCKVFRDEPCSPHHLPEFTMLEWYRVGADYAALMCDCEKLLASAASALHGGTAFVWQGAQIDFAPPFRRLSVRDAFEKHAGVKLTFGESLEELRAAAQRAGCPDIVSNDTWDDVFFKIFLRHVEPKIGVGRPEIIFDYPARMAALSRIKPDDPLVCERFELYAGGLELANAFGELTDAVEQRRRFEEDNALRRTLGRAELPIDEELLAALQTMPACAGIALGVDRLVMLLLDEPDIRNVVPLAG